MQLASFFFGKSVNPFPSDDPIIISWKIVWKIWFLWSKCFFLYFIISAGTRKNGRVKAWKKGKRMFLFRKKKLFFCFFRPFRWFLFVPFFSSSFSSSFFLFGGWPGLQKSLEESRLPFVWFSLLFFVFFFKFIFSFIFREKGKMKGTREKKRNVGVEGKVKWKLKKKECFHFFSIISHENGQLRTGMKFWWIKKWSKLVFVPRFLELLEHHSLEHVSFWKKKVPITAQLEDSQWRCSGFLASTGRMLETTFFKSEGAFRGS